MGFALRSQVAFPRDSMLGDLYSTECLVVCYTGIAGTGAEVTVRL